MMTIDTLRNLQDSLRGLTGQFGFLAGGCVRDFLFHASPKDYDFVIPCRPEWEECDVFAIMSRISNELASQGVESSVYAAYGEAAVGEKETYRNDDSDFRAMFLGCMKVDFGGADVDILFSVYPSINEHVSNHDCSVNKVWVSNQGIEGYPTWLGPLAFRPGVSAERVEYMTRKYVKLCASGGIEPRYE